MVPYNASTAKVLIAVSTVTVNHDGRGGTAPDPLFWDQGGPKKHASIQVHGGCSSGADIAAWPYSVGILCKFTSFLGTLHLPTCPGDIGHFGPPPEFTGTKASEFKNYREKVRRWLLFTRTPAQLQGPHVLSRLTGPAWDACDELEPGGASTADGAKMILDALAEAFQDEYDVDGPHTAYVSQMKEALFEQEEDIDLETAIAALELESDTDLEETDVQEIRLAYKKPRQLRGEQRVSC